MGHEEVAYEGWNCPVCEALKDKEKIENDMVDLKQEVDDLRFELMNWQQEEK